MFRKMRRFKQELSAEECRDVLKTQPRGVLSLQGENGYPYGVPMDFWYNPEDGRLYFHCAKEGYKLDAIRTCDKASFCVLDEGWRREGEWALNIRSVIVFGRMTLVDDPETTRKACTELCKKFTDDAGYAEKEWASAGARVLCLALTPDHMTGKLVNES